MKITSQPLTFLDTTDSRKLEVYISSNRPTIQLYDVNDKKYTPDWSATNLKLSADVFLDSIEKKPEKMKWYRQYINETTETLVSSGDYTEEITVNNNMAQAVVTYICRVEYQGIQAFSKITFTRTDTGLNGTDGKDGTSVTIDGTAYYNETLSDDMVGQLILLYADDEFTIPLDTSSMVEGDSYVVQGYLCVYSPANDKFICVGRIQGPKGENGDNAKSIVLSGDSQVFKANKNTPIAYTPNTIKLTANRINIPGATTLTWSYNHNDNKGWTTVKPDSVVINGDTATITGASMITDSLTIKVSDGTVEDVFTVYRAFDGADGVKGDTASMAFLTNENTSFPAGADGKTNVLTTFRTNIVAYNGTEKVTPTIGSISDIYGNLPEGMSVVPNKGTAYAKVELTANNAVISDLYSDKDTKNVINKSKLTNGDSFVVGDYLYKYDSTNQNFKSNTVTVDEVTYLDRIVTNNEITLLFSVPTGKNFGKDGNAVGEVTIPVISPVSTNLLLSWTKINAGPEGEPGVGINKIDVEYGKSENLDIKPENISWSSTIPIVEDGWYLWTKTIIDYTDPNKQDTVTYTYAKQGSKGDTGTSISEVDIEYIASNNPTTPPSSGWSPVVIATTVEKPYLWTKTTFKLEDGATKNAYSVARYGTDGAKGDKGDQGIQGIQGPKGDQGIQGPAGANGKPSYFHIKYSANSNGNPMTETPSTYIGTYVDDQADDSADYLKYTWSRFIGSQGEKGDQGIAGKNGADGKTSYLHIAYATSSNGSSGFSVSDSANKTYIGQYTDYTEEDSTDYTKYKWTLIKGDKGDKGDQGVQGPKGNDGQQLYTWIKYADTPTSGMSNDPTGKTYIGLAYNKTTATESSTYSDYMWSLIKGETGPTGPKGNDGQQYYTWIKYADNASGANMSDSPTGKLYIGLAYNKTTSTESNTASDYTWALFKGDKGETGAIGAPGTDAVTFQVYSSNGYALSINTPTLTLQTFAYIGDVAITAGATYQWYVYNDSGWTVISGGTNAYLTITREDVTFSKSYMCKMTFNGVEYTSVATIDDKNDENKVFTTKPSNYAAGDIWVVGVDYAPAGVEVGTLLRAEHTNATYGDVDWVTATKYDKELNDLKNNIETYNQYFSFDSAEGLKISAKDNNGTPSQFSTSLTNERLSFNYGNEAIAYINGTKMNIKEAEIESPLTVTGKYSGSTMLQAPVINIGNFSIIVESNGSLSIVTNT